MLYCFPVSLDLIKLFVSKISNTMFYLSRGIMKGSVMLMKKNTEFQKLQVKLFSDIYGVYCTQSSLASDKIFCLCLCV